MTLHGATLGVNKRVLKAPGFQASFVDDFGSDLEAPGTAKTWVSCGSVVGNHSLTDPRIWAALLEQFGHQL